MTTLLVSSLSSVPAYGSQMQQKCGGQQSSSKITLLETWRCPCSWRMARWAPQMPHTVYARSHILEDGDSQSDCTCFPKAFATDTHKSLCYERFVMAAVVGWVHKYSQGKANTLFPFGALYKSVLWVHMLQNRWTGELKLCLRGFSALLRPAAIMSSLGMHIKYENKAGVLSWVNRNRHIGLLVSIFLLASCWTTYLHFISFIFCSFLTGFAFIFIFLCNMDAAILRSYTLNANFFHLSRMWNTK